MRRVLLATAVLLLPAQEVLRAQTAADTLALGAISPHAYLDSALSVLRTHSLHRAQIDWAAVSSEAHRRVPDRTSTADSYDAIRWVIAQLGDHHSQLWTPERAEEFRAPSDTGSLPWYMTPRGRLIGRVGYVLVPRFAGREDQIGAYSDSLSALIRMQDERGACGWVVDLRENTGGSLLPMFGGLRPLLGDGPLVTWDYGDGTSTAWTYDLMVEEVAQRYDFEGPWPGETSLRDSTSYVAVLTGPLTSSAAEGVALAFRGRPRTRSFGFETQGLSTANDAFELPDGAELILTVAIMGDRSGQHFDGGPIPPDVVVEDKSGFRPSDRAEEDPVLQRALSWLREQGICRHPSSGI